MVSQRTRAESRNRLITAAAAEFAARGFAGAKVDRIAARARLNKAMIYYHFRNKASLYREILVDVFRTIAEAVEAGITEGTPEEQIRQFIATMMQTVGSRPHFASMWLREMADGGAHIDASVIVEITRVLTVLDGIVERGQQAGRFGPAHPLVTQLGIVAPLLFFMASAPARERMAKQGVPLITPQREDLVRHIEAATLGALHASGAVPSPERQQTRRQRT